MKIINDPVSGIGYLCTFGTIHFTITAQEAAHNRTRIIGLVGMKLLEATHKRYRTAIALEATSLEILLNAVDEPDDEESDTPCKPE